MDLPRGITAAQRRVLDAIKADIDAARTKTFEEWFEDRVGRALEVVRTEFNNESRYERFVQGYRRFYDDGRRGEALITASGQTIAKLERLGLIQILDNSTGSRNSYSLDRIKLLNY